MSLRTWGAVAGLLGGLCWLALGVVDLFGTSGAWTGVASWAGLVLLALALAVVGAGLVSRSAAWLRALVAVAFPLLLWSLYVVVRGSDAAPLPDAVVGLVAVLAAAVALVRSRRRRPAAEVERPGRHGSHAAR